eukprot:193306-Amphidinium_carterae.1
MGGLGILARWTESLSYRIPGRGSADIHTELPTIALNVLKVTLVQLVQELYASLSASHLESSLLTSKAAQTMTTLILDSA